MPAAKRRRNRANRKRQRESNTKTFNKQRPSLTDTQKTRPNATCAFCHCHENGVVKRSCEHDICEVCLPPDTSSLKCPLCPPRPEGLLASVVKSVVNIGKVKNLWMSASDDQTGDTAPRSCSVHAPQPLQLLCLQCDQQVCSLCKLAEHEGHRTQSLSLAATEARDRVLRAKDSRLLQLQSRLQKAVRETKQRRDALSQMRQDAEDSIHRRHAQLLHILDEHRDSALLQLEAMAAEADSDFQADEDRLQMELNVLDVLMLRVERSVSDCDPSDVLVLDRKLESEWSSDEISVRRSKTLPSHTYKLEHKYASDQTVNSQLLASTGDVKQLNDRISQYIGHPRLTKTTLPKLSLDVKVTPVFRCCEDPEAYVLSVCPTGEEKLAVSFTTNKDLNQGVTKSFYQDGRPSKSFDFGLCTLRGLGNGVFCPGPYPFVNITRFIMTFSGRVIWPKLHNGQSKCMLIYVPNCTWALVPFPNPSLPLPLRILIALCSGCQCVDLVSPLAFDVADGGRVLAVVDVRNTQCSPSKNYLDKQDRVVNIITYTTDRQCYVVDSYEPPTTDFVPSDVCFYTLKGETVLLISDMKTDSIHVVKLIPYLHLDPLSYLFTCKFERYLIADCDGMKQPTALNKDEQGRLWVACKGGQLLVVEPNSASLV